MTEVTVIQSGCWILFSPKVKEKRTIRFSESGSAEAVYYVQRARWGPTLGELKNRDLECVLFIAAEFYEEQYQDVWYDRNVCKLKDSKDVCIMRLDQRFHYGQGITHKHRFLVYHPASRQEMKQGRFRGNNLAVLMEEAGNVLPEVSFHDVSVKLSEKTFKSIRQGVDKVLGDKLHAFPSPRELVAGTYIQALGKSKPIMYTTNKLFHELQGDSTLAQTSTVPEKKYEEAEKESEKMLDESAEEILKLINTTLAK